MKNGRYQVLVIRLDLVGKYSTKVVGCDGAKAGIFMKRPEKHSQHKTPTLAGQGGCFMLEALQPKCLPIADVYVKRL
ncbi:MAG TPA: hypothetical protein VF690_17170 [Hymenobacter sp.]|jgi:hypothetical protein